MMMRNAKELVLKVASELSQQGFVLEHEWSEHTLDKTLLYTTATKLEEQIAALLMIAAQIEDQG